MSQVTVGGSDEEPRGGKEGTGYLESQRRINGNDHPVAGKCKGLGASHRSVASGGISQPRSPVTEWSEAQRSLVSVLYFTAHVH